MRNGFPGIFWGTRELKGLGTMEGRCEAHFAGFFGVYLEEAVRRLSDVDGEERVRL